MKKLVLLFVLVVCFSCKKETKTIEEPQAIKKSALIEAFKYTKDAPPIISVHRGGKGIKNYPENCLETLQYVNDSISAIYEIDVARTKDNRLVLLHDNSLNRTTTGEGKLLDYTLDQLKAFNLVDDFGNETAFKIPLFKDVLIWAKNNNVVLTIDLKKSVSVGLVANMIKEVEAEDVSLIITYDLQQAQKAYKHAPNLMLSVSARNEKELDWLLHSNIPTENMMAFTGTRFSSDAFYAKVHSYGIKTILGTLGNLDKQAEAKGDALYKRWKDKGIDVFATDRPFAAAKALGVTK